MKIIVIKPPRAIRKILKLIFGRRIAKKSR